MLQLFFIRSRINNSNLISKLSLTLETKGLDKFEAQGISMILWALGKTKSKATKMYDFCSVEIRKRGLG